MSHKRVRNRPLQNLSFLFCSEFARWKPRFHFLAQLRELCDGRPLGFSAENLLPFNGNQECSVIRLAKKKSTRKKTQLHRASFSQNDRRFVKYGLGGCTVNSDRRADDAGACSLVAKKMRVEEFQSA